MSLSKINVNDSFTACFVYETSLDDFSVNFAKFQTAVWKILEVADDDCVNDYGWEGGGIDSNAWRFYTRDGGVVKIEVQNVTDSVLSSLRAIEGFSSIKII